MFVIGWCPEIVTAAPQLARLAIDYIGRSAMKHAMKPPRWLVRRQFPSMVAPLLTSTTVQRLMAQTIFYPTLLWNMALGRWLKVRNWWDAIDDTIIVGAWPFATDVPALADLGVTGVVNTCEEYCGPVGEYHEVNIDQFRMPTIDFTHPLLDDVVAAVDFIQKHADHGGRVYIHCKAGRARSATVAICWLMKTQQISRQQAQAMLLEKRPHINPRLTERPVVQEFEKAFVTRR